jgi:hypothetical protein
MTLAMKNVAGPSFEPGLPMPNVDPEVEGFGVFEETAQDQQLNPGFESELIRPLLPPHLAPWVNNGTVGDAHPELDEVGGAPGGIYNVLTDVPMLEGFVDTLGPHNPAGTINEAYTSAGSVFMGTWPVPNRVSRNGSFKAPQLREVELTGPYFHNGGKLTLRQVVDFYTRGGDFPITNGTHRDFNIMNLNAELQSNLSEDEKVALVDFLLELTDPRVLYERGPFDHPQVILPLDGTAPESDGTVNRDVMLTGCSETPLLLPDGSNKFGPGQQSCFGGMFLNVPAVGRAGNPATAPLPNFLNISNQRLVGAAANCGVAYSQYCR